VVARAGEVCNSLTYPSAMRPGKRLNLVGGSAIAKCLGFEKGLGESCRRRWSFCREKGTLAVPAPRLALACLLLVRSESQWADLVQLYICPLVFILLAPGANQCSTGSSVHLFISTSATLISSPYSNYILQRHTSAGGLMGK
jgi:hypothetical protein